MTGQQQITPDLRQWIEAQLAQGFGREQIVPSMISSGWQAAVAEQAFDLVLEKTRVGGAIMGLDHPRQANHPLPEPDLSAGTPTLWLGDRRVNVLLSLNHPRIVLLGGLLSDEECDAMVAAAEVRLARSETVASNPNGSEVNAARTSDGMFFERGENDVVRRIEARLAQLLNWPVDHGEGLQVLRYRPGAEYLPHYDYFDPHMAGSAAILSRGGQRVGTVVIYLNTPAAGGATIFPDVKLEVLPVKGNAVFFGYERPDPSTLTLHGGAPVREGEKWVATKWLREGVFV
ncbi:2OG-Fe(II) oxygenase [Paucibacter sp. AS339]|uniref:2OG-Fe(II) oxygenase n=1 Tax=Paucibacter hankyongi TaxID=3133434 RepID=UPI0030AA7223